MGGNPLLALSLFWQRVRVQGNSRMDSSLDAEDGAVEGSRLPSLDELYAEAYDQLRLLAGIERRRWRDNHTLNTTALVHEVYVKLSGDRGGLRNPDRLLAVAARAMRHVLVNYAEEQRAVKRGGELARVRLATLAESEGAAGGSSTWDEVLSLDAALDRLGEVNARQRNVVECRFFGGLSVEETSAALEISTATVKRDWRFARTWLYRELAPAPFAGEGER